MSDDFRMLCEEGDLSVAGVIGSTRVLFIKTGQGGSVYGDGNRYRDLALEMNGRLGISVFVSATVKDDCGVFAEDMRIIEQCLGTASFRVYYLGVSKGGLIGCWYGADDRRIKRMVSINAPLMINYHGKTLPGVKRLGRDRLTMIYGSLDASYKYVPFVEKHAEVRIIDGADHNLENTSVTLSDIVTDYLLV